MDRVGKAGIAAMLAVSIGVLTTAGAHSGEAARAGTGVPMRGDWTSSGQNNHNTRSAAAEHKINAGNVGNLKTE
jgi:polyvinyl alcohol dehydrogenase (cytochrome)